MLYLFSSAETAYFVPVVSLSSPDPRFLERSGADLRKEQIRNASEELAALDKFKLVVNRGFFPPSDIFRFLLENQHEEVILFFLILYLEHFVGRLPSKTAFINFKHQ
ncbi:hypothetical protein MRB53_016025 [Persea americana]|uniref:Uncharacterized protein n=1 Tax=Persea americana TaxID=3435 RepID=A0ACC2M149_PERAE|nr:hypothetical protein MRB53_016025 [Persea americana]